MKKQIKSTSGFSMVEGIIAAGIVAVSILAISAVVAQHSKTMRTARSKQEVPGVSTDVLNRARSVLLDTKDNNGRATQGICSVLEPTEIRPGTVPINLVLNRAMTTQAAWTKAFSPDWKIDSYKTVGGGGTELYVRPVLDKNPIVSTNTIDAKTLVVKVIVSPRSMDPSDSAKVFSKLRSGIQAIDAKRAAYMLEAETTYDAIQEDGKREQKKVMAKDLVSVLDVGACDIANSAGQLFKMSPAGTGLGDPEGRTIYNNTEYHTTGVNVFDISMSAMEVVQGKYENGRLSADRSANVVSACTETRYRCPKSREARDYKSFVNFTANIGFNARNQYGSKSPVRFTPLVKFKDEASQDLIARYGMDIDYRISGEGLRTASYRKHSNGLFYPVGENGALIMNEPLLASRETGIIRVQASVNNAEGMCRNVCNPANPGLVKTDIALTTPDYEVNGQALTEEASASMPLHCTMCFVKGCTRMGYETFGPVTEMPPEPLDAQMPECAAQETAENRKLLPYASEDVQDVSSGNNGKCVSAKIVGDKLQYKIRNCSEALPTLCFAFGEYTFARDTVDAAGKALPATAAVEACRNLGMESHPTEVLREGLAQQNASTANLNRIPASGGRYRFLNLAKVGTFVVPQSAEEQEQAIAALRAVPAFRSQISGEFWVALKPFEGTLVARAPQAMTSNDADQQHLLYYSPAGVQTHAIVEATPYTYVARGSGAHVLFNNVKFRGLVETSTTQSSSRPFLCMKKSDRSFFVTANGSSRNFEDGGTQCEQEGGLFVPPHSPAAWMQALLLVEPHGNYAPFPETLVSNNSAPRAVWVALDGNQNPVKQGEMDLPRGKVDPPGTAEIDKYKKYPSLMDRNGFFADENDVLITITIPPPPGAPANTPAETKEVEDPSLRIMVACYSQEGRKVSVRPEAQGCQSHEERVRENDFKQKHFVALLWALNKGSFDLGSKTYIRINDKPAGK